MASRKDISVLEHMRMYADEIECTMKRFGNTFEVFSEDKDFYKSISMSIMQIGELTTHLSDEFKVQNKEIPWALIKGIRNLFAHEYEKMRVKTVWDVATNEIPALSAQFKEIIQKSFNAEP